jgi:hypothetical protein
VCAKKTKKKEKLKENDFLLFLCCGHQLNWLFPKEKGISGI